MRAAEKITGTSLPLYKNSPAPFPFFKNIFIAKLTVFVVAYFMDEHGSVSGKW